MSRACPTSIGSSAAPRARWRLRQRFAALRVQAKVTGIAMFTAGLALALACTAFGVIHHFDTRRDVVARLSATAAWVGMNVARDLATGNREAIERTLQSVRAERDVMAAAAYTPDGALVASHRSPGQAQSVVPARVGASAVSVLGDVFEVVRPIEAEGQTVGWLFVRGSPGTAGGFGRSVPYSILVMLGAGGVAFVFVARLRQLVPEPVDVDALKHAQAAAAREQARLKIVFELSPVGICLHEVRRDGHQDRMLNDAHLRICGLTREEAVFGVFQRITHPDDLARQMDLRDKLERREIDRFSIEKRYFTPDGRTVWVAYTLQRRWSADGSYEDLSTIVDITALKLAQEQVAAERARFKFIFEAVPVGISLLSLDSEGRHLGNPAHDRITGVPASRMDEPGIFARATHPEDWERQRSLIQSYKSGRIDRFTLEKRYLHPGGRVVWASLARRMFTDADTGRKFSITTLVDITERKEAEAKLAATHKQLLESSRQAGMAEVATGVLHNVGNVLNSVNVSASLLGDALRQSKVSRVARLAELLAEHQNDLAQFLAHDPRGRKVPGYVQSLAAHLQREHSDLQKELDGLRKNVEHIKDIVAMQQSYAKVSGVSEFVAVTDLVEDALRMDGETGRRDIGIVRQFGANPSVSVEKHKVLQILVNLLHNAKFACEARERPDKQIVLRTEQAGDRVAISVIDNGVGIPAENLTRIFHHGFTTRKDGHGFGLHSGALAAKELGGSLRVHGEGVGHGATFTLELPVGAALPIAC